MFSILARTLRTASRTETEWDAPDAWKKHDHRTHAERKRDQAEQRRMLRFTGIL